ncbi:MAG: ATP-dependent Clp protease proteolytic subunit [Candidatus Muirbacterium halophilum]|nr:ATP-dependent Clp protease proteolytic subunit [Candidatus Muirbacterium halophilum]
MNINSDFEKYIKSSKVNQEHFNMYKQTINCSNNNDNVVDVFSKLFDNRILMLSGEVDGYICELLKAQLLYLEEIDSKKDITIYCNSGGGSVYHGLGLIDIIEYVSPEIITVNTGLAASMAAVILCSGTKGKRKALKRSRTLIHQPLSYGGRYIQQASDIMIDAKEIDTLKKELYEIISTQTGQSYDKVCKDGDRDFWMNATEAKRYGMIDEIISNRK